MSQLISPYLQTIFWAWLIAHIVKYLLISIKNNDFRFTKKVFDSGGMPSAHTTTVSALTFIVGMVEGFNSSIFAVAFLVALIVIHDAVRVRRSTGEQGIAINKLIKNSGIGDIELPHFSKGHTPKEAVVGIILGMTIGLIVFLATK